ncbi:NTP transferase domain-containing protein [Marivibrio halodurans]|uniref:NTP transferase domain-containing protein n=1 Tax=Marivibrio halodurans TaxID=2039722 RepID=A0A8J7RZG0_9PROT|nr:NTP transferase domain-containing protein [Marivibrio halodurans]MBP5855884.1 NTP transferase domain-containing protein [Marivibrio halodurans]
MTITSAPTTRGPAALILLARLDSRRLPGKGLMDLAGRPVLGRAIDRLRRCRVVPAMLLATSDRAVDDDLEAFARAEGIGCFRGDASDVAGRCLAAMEAHGLDWFVRICGDSPFVDPEVTDAVAEAYLADPTLDIATNVFPRGYPIGASAEAVSRPALARICAATQALEWREHVTAWAYEHAADFKIRNISPNHSRYRGLSIAVDTPEDLARARAAIARLPDPTDATLAEVVTAYA